jgi:uncharacterized protein
MSRAASRLMQFLARTGRFGAHFVIRAYQLTLSSIAGAHCRHLPTCSEYMDEAIARHGLWAGGAMGIARFCRCHPWGTSGFDPVPKALATPRAVVAPVDLCRTCRHGTGRGIGLSHRLPAQEGQRHGAGIRDIEGLDRAGHVEAHKEIAIFPAEAPHPLAFAAEHERNRAPQRRLRQI